MKIGVFLATHNSPLFLRLQLLQLVNQSVKPDYVAIHENGAGESYFDFHPDIDFEFGRIWIRTAHKISGPTCDWQRPALKALIEEQCDVYFALDHDNIVFRDHIENIIKHFPENDIVACKTSDILILGRDPYEWQRDVNWFGISGLPYMASSVAFNHKVAVDLCEAMKGQKRHPDRVLQDLLPKYKLKTLDTKGVCFVSHPESTTYAKP